MKYLVELIVDNAYFSWAVGHIQVIIVNDLLLTDNSYWFVLLRHTRQKTIPDRKRHIRFTSFDGSFFASVEIVAHLFSEATTFSESDLTQCCVFGASEIF